MNGHGLPIQNGNGSYSATPARLPELSDYPPPPPPDLVAPPPPPEDLPPPPPPSTVNDEPPPPPIDLKKRKRNQDRDPSVSRQPLSVEEILRKKKEADDAASKV